MAELVLFHSVLGVRQGILDAAATMEAAGHTIHVPNLYEPGTIFDEYEPAMAHVEAIGGYPTLMQRSLEAVRDLPAGLVYAGFSNGGGSAQYLALTRPGAKGALLFAAAAALKWFDAEDGTPARWPSSVPVQVHYMVDDPFREQEELDAFAEGVRASGAPFTLYEYQGAGHLFTDRTLPAEYDEGASRLLWERSLAFLRDIDRT